MKLTKFVLTLSIRAAEFMATWLMDVSIYVGGLALRLRALRYEKGRQ